MKTPMQEVFAHLRASKETDSFGEVYCVDWLLENEKSFLEKEKEVMCGIYDDSIARFDRNYLGGDGERYYNATFKPIER